MTREIMRGKDAQYNLAELPSVVYNYVCSKFYSNLHFSERKLIEGGWPLNLPTYLLIHTYLYHPTYLSNLILPTCRPISIPTFTHPVTHRTTNNFSLGGREFPRHVYVALNYEYPLGCIGFCDPDVYQCSLKAPNEKTCVFP